MRGAFWVAGPGCAARAAILMKVCTITSTTIDQVDDRTAGAITHADRMLAYEVSVRMTTPSRQAFAELKSG